MEEDVIEIYNNDTSPEVDFEINDVIYTGIPSGEIEEMKEDIAQNTADILLRALITETGNKIDLEINSSTFVMVAKLYDKNNNLLSTSSAIDLPLESMVVDAAYDAQTQEIVLTLKNGNTTRFSIADLVNGLASQDDVDALEERVDIVEDRMDVVEEIMPTVSATGTEITLQNTKKAGMKVALGGNTEQASTSGVNLLPIPQQASETTNGATFSTDGKGKYTISGKLIVATNTYKDFPISKTFQAGTYYWHLRNTGTITGSISIALRAGNSTANYVSLNEESRIASFTLAEAKTIDNVRLTIGTQYGTTDNINIELEPSIELGSTATDYEPYTNGASPNPDYPQDIHVVTGENTVNVCGKNLLEANAPEHTSNGILFKVNNDGTFNISGTATSTYSNLIATNARLPIYLNKNVNYTFWINQTLTFQFRIRFYDKNGNMIATESIAAGDKYITFSLNENTVSFYLYANAMTNGNTYNISSLGCMICEGTTIPTIYEKYNEINYPINLGTIELCKIGDYQDRIFKAVDGDIYYDTLTAAQKAGLTYGKWYLHKEVGKATLNGTEESWVLNREASGMKRYALSISDITSVASNDAKYVLSSYFVSSSFNETINDDADENRICVVSNSRIVIKTIDENLMSLDTFKSWLSTHNTTVYYILAASTNTEITDTALISQLEAIYLAKSAEGTTTITQTNADLGFILTAIAFENINMEGYVRDTDYATTSKAGVVKTNASSFATALNTSGVLYAITKTYNDYEAMSNQGFIGKGTLENVLSERYKPQVVLTQAEYDAITTPDENTLYIIKEA